MPDNGSGVYTPISPDFPAVGGTLIESAKFNNIINDIATALTARLSKDGQTTATGNIPMGTFRLTGLGNGSSRTDSAALGQVQDQAGTWCGTATGTANAITLTPVPAITAYVAGQKFGFIAAATSTGAVTVAVSGLATKATQNYEAALVAGEIVIGHKYEITYDGTAFQVSAAGSSYARLQAANNFTVVPTINSSPIVDEADFTWTTQAFNAADFTAIGSMTWTVDSGDVLTYAYLIVGKMMTVAFWLQNTSIGGTLDSNLLIKIPAGKIAAKRIANALIYFNNSLDGIGMCFVIGGESNIRLSKSLSAPNWSASTNGSFYLGTITFEIQ